jgi:uncharacterized protein YutE (UPF0331/DUF86 family)
MENELILTKLESLTRCVDRIRIKTPETYKILVEDVDAQDILAGNLERSVQICVDIALHLISIQITPPVPTTMADAFRVLEKQKIITPQTAQALISAVGFRNISVHAYDTINWEIVWKIVTEHLRDFSNYVKEILETSEQ